MPLPNYGGIAQPGAWQPNTGNYQNFQPQQSTAQQWPANFQQPQPVQQNLASRVMSIAPANSREIAQQFPVAVNTDLYLVNRNEMKLYFKCNPANPAEMEEYDLVKVEKQPAQSDVVTRAEVDELRSMMGQMLAMIQGGNQGGKHRPRNNGKRGNTDDRPDGLSANDG